MQKIFIRNPFQLSSVQGYQLDKLLIFLLTVYYVVNKINKSINQWKIDIDGNSHINT